MRARAPAGAEIGSLAFRRAPSFEGGRQDPRRRIASERSRRPSRSARGLLRGRTYKESGALPVRASTGTRERDGGEDMGSSWSRTTTGVEAVAPRRVGLAVLALLSALLAAVLLVPGAAVAANPAADLDQCGNGQLGSPNSCPPGWENGNLNASKSHYREGDSVPFRLLLTNLATSGTHTIVIQYDTLQSGKHAYDYLTSFNRTVGDADPCGSGGAAGGSAISPCASGGSFAIPGAGISFTNPGSSQVGGSVSIWNGTLTGISYGGASDASGQQSVTIKFTASNATVVLAWSGHIASQIDWGLG